MKKVSAILVALLLVATTAFTAFAAGINADEQKVLDAVSGTLDVNGTEIAWPASYVNQAENYFNTIDLTSDQADAIISEIDSAKAFLKAHDFTDFSKASEADRKDLFKFMKNSMAVVGGKATYDRTTGEVTLTDANGEVLMKVVPTFVIKGQEDKSVDKDGNKTDGGVIKTTGTGVDTTMIVVLSVAAAVVIAGGVFFVVKKRA